MFGFKLVKNQEIQSLREEMSVYKRQLEDLSWINLSIDPVRSQGSAFNGQLEFEKMIVNCRILFYKNPLIGQWCNLVTNFVFGEGVSTPTSNDKLIQEHIAGFWDDKDNQVSLTSFHAQDALSKKIVYEGNMFFLLFDDDAGNVRVRVLNTIEVADVIYDPQDRGRPVFYKVKASRTQYNFGSDSYSVVSNGFVYYPAHDNYDPLSYNIPSNKLIDNVRVIHFKINCDINDRFGIPEIYRATDWVQAHKGMAEDLATLIKALSQYAWKKKVKGTATQISTIAANIVSKTNLSNIKNSAGQMQVENEGVDLQSIDIKTGGVKVGTDGLRQMKLQVCSASGIFEHYFGDPSCYDVETEALTENGWKKYDEWKGERVACFNPDKNQIEYHKPVDLHVFKHQGEMIHLKTSRQDIFVTPNHRMWAFPSFEWRNPSWRIVEAKEMLNRRWRVRNACHQEETVDLEYSDDWLRFIGYFASEGHTLSPYKQDGTVREKKMMRIGISQHRGEILERMRSTMKSLNLHGYESENQCGVVTIYTHDEELWAWLREHCGAESNEKQIPEYILKCSTRQQRIVLDALIEGDGGHQGRDHGTCVRYSTRSQKLADQVQVLSIHQGWQANIQIEEDPKRGVMYRVNIAKERDFTDIYPERIKQEYYNGVVWCFHVPYGLFVTRRNGKVAIQGNTGNLATAKSMELPMVKKFSGYQMFWTSVYLQIINYMIDRKIEAGVLPGQVIDDAKLRRRSYVYAGERNIDIDFPPILEQDLKESADALSIAKDKSLITDDLAAELFMLSANINNIDEELELLKSERELKKSDELEMLKRQQSQQNTNNQDKDSPIKESIDLPSKRIELRSKKKEAFVLQKMNGYRKSVSGHFKTLLKEVRDAVKVSGSDGRFVGHVPGYQEIVHKFLNGMRESARAYYPIAVDIGEKFMQAMLKDVKPDIKIHETIYESNGKAKGILSDRLKWNDYFLYDKLEPDLIVALEKTIKQAYNSSEEFTEAVYNKMKSFEPRMEMYVGSFWTVEQEAVKEAGRGTGVMVNFVGPDDDHNCDGCNAAVNGGPYLIDQAPLPGEQECLSRCRHALQVITE